MILVILIPLAVAILFMWLSIVTSDKPSERAHLTYVVGMLGYEEFTSCLEACWCRNPAEAVGTDHAQQQ